MGDHPKHGAEPGVSRRGFIASMGGGALGAAALGPPPAGAAPAAVPAPGESATLGLCVNGTPRRVPVEARTTLLEVLRGTLGLTGTKEGCGRGECGACTVLLGGAPRYACMTLALEAGQSEVTTVSPTSARAARATGCAPRFESRGLCCA